MGALPPEAPYEIAGDCFGCVGGPCTGRTAGKGRGGVLLAGWSVWVVGDPAGTGDVEQLARAAGGKVVHRGAQHVRGGVGGARVVLHHDGMRGEWLYSSINVVVFVIAAVYGWHVSMYVAQHRCWQKAWCKGRPCGSAWATGWPASRRAHGGQQVAHGQHQQPAAARSHTVPAARRHIVVVVLPS